MHDDVGGEEKSDAGSGGAGFCQVRNARAQAVIGAVLQNVCLPTASQIAVSTDLESSENLARNSHTETFALARNTAAENLPKFVLCDHGEASASAPQEVHFIGPVHFPGFASQRDQRPYQAPNVCR